MFRLQRECTYPKLVEDVSQVRLEWEEKWKAMMLELVKDVKITEEVGSFADLSQGRRSRW